MKRYSISIFLGAICLTFLSCGYNFVGTAPIVLPEDKRNLYISHVQNPTQEVWLEPYLRAAFRDEFTRRGKVNWVPDDMAEAHVQIDIIQFRTSDSLTREKDRTVRSTVTIVMESRIISAETGELIWRSGNISGSSSYFLASEDASMPAGSLGPAQRNASQDAVDQAVTRVADRLSDTF